MPGPVESGGQRCEPGARERERKSGSEWKYHSVSKIMSKHVFYDNNFKKIVFFFLSENKLKFIINFVGM